MPKKSVGANPKTTLGQRRWDSDGIITSGTSNQESGRGGAGGPGPLLTQIETKASLSRYARCS